MNYIVFLLLFATHWICAHSLTDHCIAENFEIITAQGTVTDPLSNILPGNLFAELQFSEDADQGELYSIRCTNGVLSTDPQTSLQIYSFLSYNSSQEKKQLKLSLVRNISGIVDYDNENRIDEFQLELIFKFYGSRSECKLSIQHTILDENTSTPSTDKPAYNIQIREDFPIQLTLPMSEMLNVTDFDGSDQNSIVVGTLNSECPLALVEDTFYCLGGDRHLAQFVLTRSLDYEKKTDRSIRCSLRLEDGGEPSLFTTARIFITTTAFPDEDPVFCSQFYRTILDSTQKGTNLTIDPNIEANDPDDPATSITYTMEAADSTVGGDEYFRIDSSTAQVSVATQISNEFLQNEFVSFIITAEDESYQAAISYLLIELPPPEEPTRLDVQFDQDQYVFQVLQGSTAVGIIEAQAQDGISPAYYWDDSSADTIYFDLNTKSGEITTSMTSYPDVRQYELIAFARALHDPTLVDDTNIVIVVSEVISSALPIFEEAFIKTTVLENGQADELLAVVTAEGADIYCLAAVTPSQFQDSIYVIKETGHLMTSQPLNADIYEEAPRVQISALSNTNQCPAVQEDIDQQLDRNEIVIAILITDENDNPPMFTDENGHKVDQLIVAYPENVLLQTTVGPVSRLQGSDQDITSDLKYSLNETVNFLVDDVTGQIFCNGQCLSSCGDGGCVLEAGVSDGQVTHSVPLTILPLPAELIHTFTNISTVDLASVDAVLLSLSGKVGVSIRQVYSRVYNDHVVSRSDGLLLEVHVHVLNGTQLIELDDFNELLESGGFQTASEFTELSYYATMNSVVYPDDSHAALTLGLCILAVVISCVIALTAFYYVKRRTPPVVQKPISTLSQIYKLDNVLQSSLSSESEDDRRSFEKESQISKSCSETSSETASLGLISVHSIENQVNLSALNNVIDVTGLENKAYQNDEPHSPHVDPLPRPTLDISSSNQSPASSTNFKQSPNQSDVETKSVSFKVLVDARIIPADSLQESSENIHL